MKRAVFTLWLLLAAVAATAQSEPTPPEFEYSDLQRLTPEDYIDMQLPPLHVLMENARHAPQVGYYESNREIEERELKTVRRNWTYFCKWLEQFFTCFNRNSRSRIG